MDLNTTKQQLELKKDDLLRERAVWESRWKIIRDHMLPTHGWFDSDFNESGKRRNPTLMNDTPAWAISVMAAGMQSGLTSPNNQWFRLMPEDVGLYNDDSVRKYLGLCEEIISSQMSKSGVYDAFFTSYEELAAFGVGGFLMLEDPVGGFYTIPLTIGEYAIGVDSKKLPSEFFRSIEMTPEQMIERFGDENVSPETKNDYENFINTPRKINHLITKNDGRIDTSRGLQGKPYFSWYWEEGSGGDSILSVEGYDEFPAIISRWTVTGPNSYGYGPGEMALGDATQLQKIESDKLTALQMTLRPPVAIPANMMGRVSLLPTAQNYYDPSQGTGEIKPILQVNPNMQDTAYEIERIEERIKRAFNVNMFLALIHSNQEVQKTATEINEMHQEKLLMIGPVLQRLDREMLKPCIDRAFAILERQGLFPEPPEVLLGSNLGVEYLSPLMLAQRAESLNSIDRFMMFIGTSIAQLDTTALDNIDLDKMTLRYGIDLGVPSEIFRGREEVEMMRQARAEQQQMMQQQQQQMQEAEMMVNSAEKLGQANVGEESLLGTLMSGGGAGIEGGGDLPPELMEEVAMEGEEGVDTEGGGIFLPEDLEGMVR